MRKKRLDKVIDPPIIDTGTPRPPDEEALIGKPTHKMIDTPEAQNNKSVHLVDERLPSLARHAPLEFQSGSELAVLHGEVAREDAPVLDLGHIVCNYVLVVVRILDRVV